MADTKVSVAEIFETMSTARRPSRRRPRWPGSTAHAPHLRLFIDGEWRAPATASTSTASTPPPASR